MHGPRLDPEMALPAAAPAALRSAGWALALWPLGWLAGTALQLQQSALWPLAGYGAAAFLSATALLLAWRWRHRAAPMGLACLLAALLGAWAAAGLRATELQQQALAPALEGVDLALTGVIDALPQADDGVQRFQFAVESAAAQGQRVAVPPLVRLAWYPPRRRAQRADAAQAPDAQEQAPPVLRAGDRWRFTVRLVAPHGNLNPHAFDYELWLWERGIRATGYIRAGPRDAPPELLQRRAGRWVERLRQSARDRIAQTLPASALRDGTAGVVTALATGDQRAIHRDDWDVFRITGVAHLVSISGLHISMIAWLAALAIGALWRGLARCQRRLPFDPLALASAPHAALLGGLVVAAAYAVFSGLGIPAQRTLVMLACVVLLRVAGLRWPWWLTWLWACWAVLVLDPWALLQAGFWLSFVAIGILFVTGDLLPQERRGGLRRYLPDLLRTQGRVTVALAPLTLMLFGQASVVGLLANLFAIPWVTLVLTPAALLGLALPWAWQLASWAAVPLLAALRVLAHWPGAQLTVAAAPLALGAAALVGALLLVQRLPWALRLAGLPLVLPLLLWQPPRPAAGAFDLLAIDIGQGNAVLVRTARHALLYDTGPRYSAGSDAGARVILPLLQALGERPDQVVLSHRDSDHTGGAAALRAAFPEVPVLASIRAGDEPHGVQVTERCRAGQRWRWDGVEFEVLYPDAAAAARARSPNAMSCVLRVRAAAATALLVGDIEAPQEALLLAAGAPLASDLLLVPHHGSKTSSSAAFLDAVQPRVALVQSGYRNRFGHPAPAVMARYRERAIAVFDSPRCGAMRWRSEQPGRVECERQTRPRYWWHHMTD